MKKNILFTLTILSSIPSSTLFGKLSLDRVYGFFGKYNHEAIVEKEFELKDSGRLVINNTQGDIVITTEWQRNTICLRATKKTSKDEDLSELEVVANYNDDQTELTISSNISITKAAIDYQLIVPAQTTLQLNADNGSIKINDAKGEIHATTLHGDIDIQNTSNTITAQTESTGNILIAHAQGNIKATTNKGNITIDDAHKSIVANTQKGHITTSCHNVPATSRIVLNTENSGGIDLKLPSTVNATLHGKTTRGRLTSDHYVTLKPFTTKLTKQTRRELEKQVDGILGTGEADIRLTSNSGNIRILEIS